MRVALVVLTMYVVVFGVLYLLEEPDTATHRRKWWAVLIMIALTVIGVVVNTVWRFFS